jgi:hypothetical protein
VKRIQHYSLNLTEIGISELDVEDVELSLSGAAEAATPPHGLELPFNDSLGDPFAGGARCLRK